MSLDKRASTWKLGSQVNASITDKQTVLIRKLLLDYFIEIPDDPKPPGPVELDQNVPGTVTLSWAPSPDETKDDRLHYAVSKWDTFKQTWKTVAEKLFNNKFTVVDIVPGREYHFRVFAKNDMGISAPSVSPVFEIKKERGIYFLILPHHIKFEMKIFLEV